MTWMLLKWMLPPVSWIPVIISAIFVSSAKVYAPKGSDAFVVLAIFKKWNKKIQKPRPFQLLFFFWGGGFSSYRPLFLFFAESSKDPSPKNPTPAALVRWSEATRHLENKGSCGMQLWHQCQQIPSQFVSLKQVPLLPSRERTYPI